MIAVVDFGVGNLRSVTKVLEADGISTLITSEPADIERADGVILPGDGAFGAVMSSLGSLKEPLLAAVKQGKPFLGICIGYQMMFDWSEESPGVAGLGLIPGGVRRFPVRPGLKVPHMGWNTLERLAARLA